MQMELRSLNYVAEACVGELRGGSPDSQVARVCSDSRLVQAGDLFFAIAGDRFDGHDFLAEVAKKGVAAVVADRARIPEGLSCPVIAVDNSRAALGRLAARYRYDFNLPLIAVGGSNGKTTTKELIASVLGQGLRTLRSEASFNNDIGVPLTLLNLDKSHQAAVLEVGTNHPGELAPLVKLARPQLGAITNLGREHLEFFGDMNGVAAEEGCLAELLPPGGTLFINGDSEWADRLTHRSRAKVVRVGTGDPNDWRASKVRVNDTGVTFFVDAPEGELSGEYSTGLIGRHQAVNALFALAVGAELKLSQAQMQRGLAECQPAKMRMQLWEWNGVRVLDDAYNANADSTLAALETLRDMPCKGRRAAVLGDMAELGTHTQSAHEEVGRRAAQLGLDRLFAAGKMSGVTAAAARAAGLAAAEAFPDTDAAAAAVKEFMQPNDLILLKASRAAKFERLAQLLRATPAPEKN